eukprot:m.1399341 g.1399341  ORF g.1399341 m.1399341 type:complete len:192 (-) comp25001_c1_seq13:649-1224(-)
MEVPYIGSKISLLSKSMIRYEGILHKIDMETATVALTQVRSFGTEQRDAPAVVPGSAEVYTHIVFRGSDIADITVCAPDPVTTPQLPPDPAIVSSVNDPIPQADPAPTRRPPPGLEPKSQDNAGQQQAPQRRQQQQHQQKNGNPQISQHGQRSNSVEQQQQRRTQRTNTGLQPRFDLVLRIHGHACSSISV